MNNSKYLLLLRIFIACLYLVQLLTYFVFMKSSNLLFALLYIFLIFIVSYQYAIRAQLWALIVIIGFLVFAFFKLDGGILGIGGRGINFVIIIFATLLLSDQIIQMKNKLFNS